MSVRRLTTLAIASVAFVSSAAPQGCEPAETTSRDPGATSTSRPSNKGNGNSSSSTSRAVVKITASDKVCWSGQVGRRTAKGCGNATLQIQDSNGRYRIEVYKTKGTGTITLVLVVKGKSVNRGTISASSGVISINYTAT